MKQPPVIALQTFWDGQKKLCYIEEFITQKGEFKERKKKRKQTKTNHKKTPPTEQTKNTTNCFEIIFKDREFGE